MISYSNPNSTRTTKRIYLRLALFFLFIVSITIFACGCFSSSYLTYENYAKIENGMSYRQVVEILDNHEGELDTSAGYGGYTLEYYSWTNSSSTRCIVVGFENGRVCAKSQYGL